MQTREEKRHQKEDELSTRTKLTTAGLEGIRVKYTSGERAV
jgi:hypothetical protein